MKPEEQEKSVDERVGAVQEGKEAILELVLKRLQATGDNSSFDEFLEEGYDDANYQDKVMKIARHKSAVSSASDELASYRKYPIGVAAWAQARGLYKDKKDPVRYIAELTGCAQDDNSELAEAAVFKDLGIANQAFATREKTLNISQPAEGGVLTRGTRVDDFFAPLRNQSVVLRFGPPIRQIVDGAITVYGLESDVAATWGEEVNTQEIASEPTWGDRDKTSKHLMVLVPIGVSALRSTAGPTIMRDINDSIRYVMGHEFDINWINATGGQFRPTGLRHLAGETTASGGVLLDDIVDDMKGLFKRMALNSVPMNNMGLLMSQRERVELQFLLDVNDRFMFRAEIENGTFFAMQMEATNEITTTENTDESFVLMVDFSGVLIGLGNTLEINTWDQGSYVVNGQTRNPITRRERVITAHSETLLIVAQPEHIEELNEVKWGL